MLWVALLPLSAQIVREVTVQGKVYNVPGDKSYERTRSYNSDEFHYVNNGVLEVHTVNYENDLPSSYVIQSVALTNLNFSACEIVYMEDDPVAPFKGAMLYIDYTKRFAKKFKDGTYISMLFESKYLAEESLAKLKLAAQKPKKKTKT